MTEKDFEEFEKEFGFKLLPTGFKKPLSEITKQEMDEFIVDKYEEYVKEKEGNEIDVQKPISYHTTLESALQSYSNNRMADLVSNFDLDLKDVKKAINELKEEIKTYDCK